MLAKRVAGVHRFLDSMGVHRFFDSTDEAVLTNRKTDAGVPPEAHPPQQIRPNPKTDTFRSPLHRFLAPGILLRTLT